MPGGVSASWLAPAGKQRKDRGKQAVEIPASPGCEFRFILLQLHGLGLSTQSLTCTVLCLVDQLYPTL